MYKSFILGSLTIGIWLVASVILNEKELITNEVYNVTTENVENIDDAFIETLTIDYGGATK